MHAAVTEESIEKANALFWEQMLAMQLHPIAEAQWDSKGVRCIGVGHVVGSCDLSGVWYGRIEVRLSRGLALQATAAMLMQPVESVQPEDTLDATKEIANMIAGTIKSALPRPCTMTVPSAEVEFADFCIPPRTADSVTVFFHHDSGELMVRVWEYLLEAESEIGTYTQLCA
jgi:CheY-specific phosphatase CheX